MSIITLYNDIKTKLQTDVPELKTIRPWNEQFQNDNVESSFDYPAFFFEWSAEWDNKPGLLQSGAVNLVFHIGLKSLKDDDGPTAWELGQKIFVALNGLKSNTYSPLIRQISEPDVNHGNVIEHVQRWFVGELIDTDSYVHKDMTTTTATEIIVDVDVDIDNYDIRTGDGQ